MWPSTLIQAVCFHNLHKLYDKMFASFSRSEGSFGNDWWYLYAPYFIRDFDCRLENVATWWVDACVARPSHHFEISKKKDIEDHTIKQVSTNTKLFLSWTLYFHVSSTAQNPDSDFCRYFQGKICCFLKQEKCIHLPSNILCCCYFKLQAQLQDTTHVPKVEELSTLLLFQYISAHFPI